ncbi:MAG: O-succinylbenzoic acid--CoA ligase [Caldilineae bacterium]|nr:MAG: O-succinylbenzoic acid--CoA ligase [Caldilineae bacterium]
MRGFVLGLRLTVVTPSANPLASLPPDARFDFTALVPLQLQTILARTPDRLPLLDGMKAILVGGAPVSMALQRALQRIAAPVYHTYGMTETVTHIALRRLNGPHPEAAFKPLPGVQVGQDERGCLTVTAPVTGGQTLHTNDRVDLQPDGSFVWLGRLDNVINSGGVKVQVERVERALERALLDYRGGVFSGRRFFVGGTPDERLGETVTVVMEGSPLPVQDEAALRAALQAALSRYEVPRRFAFLPRLPQTPTGKIDRRAALRRLSATTPPR